MSEEYFPIGIEIRDRTIAAARARLGEVAFEEEWTHGRALDYRDAVEYALGSESDAVGPLLAATTPGET